MAPLVAEFGSPGRCHAQPARPRLHDVIGDIRTAWRPACGSPEQAGLPRQRLIIDPGFGFGWAEEHSLEMLRRLGELRDFGLPVLIGTSRKSTIGAVLGGVPAGERIMGTAATVAIAAAYGADIVRVHDVAEMVQVCRMADAVVRHQKGPGP
jgi:dihydropteroate synthase